MSKSTPDAPDPALLAQQQSAANVDAAETQARLNRIDETSPLGSVTFGSSFDQAGFDQALQDFNTRKSGLEQNLGRPLLPNELINQGLSRPTENEFETFNRATELTQTGQETFSQQQNLGLALSQLANQQAGRVGETLGTPLDFSGATPLPSLDEDARLRIEDALFQRQADRLNQRFGDEQERLDTRLANQGIQAGSDTFNRSQESFGRTQNDAFDIATQNAIAGGIGEQGRLFNLGLQSRNQGIGEIQALRNSPINDIGALLSNSQLSIPSFGAIPQVGVAAPDVLGANALALNQGNIGAQQNQQLQNNLFGLGGSLGSAAILSDRRLKKNIKKIGNLLNGLAVYVYDYLWGERGLGVMADEVKRIKPEAVVNINGYDHVDYMEILNA